MIKKNIGKRITFSKLIFLSIFVLLFVFMIWLFLSGNRISFNFNNQILNYFSDLILKILFLIIPLIIIIKIFKTMFFKVQIWIDNIKDSISIVSFIPILGFIKKKFLFNITEIQEIILILVSKHRIDFGTVNLYQVYLIDRHKYYKKICNFTDYSEALNLVAFISEGTGIKYNDYSDITYITEYDFFKFYNK